MVYMASVYFEPQLLLMLWVCCAVPPCSELSIPASLLLFMLIFWCLTVFVVAYFLLSQERGWIDDEEKEAVLAGAHIYFQIKWQYLQLETVIHVIS